MNPQIKQLLLKANRIKLLDEIKATKDFDLVVDLVDSLMTALAAQKEAIEKQTTKVEEQAVVVENVKLKQGPKGDKGDKGDKGKDYVLTNKDKKEIAGKIEVPVVEKIIEKTEIIKEQPIVTNEIKEVAVADTGEQIVQKINDLPTDEDELLIDMEHIDGLLKELKELRRLASQTSSQITGIVGRGRIKNYDLSSQLNGVLKTFNLPANWAVINVVASSFPGALRPTIDYTNTPTSITFTSEITASTTLATGQTVIVIYEEA